MKHRSGLEGLKSRIAEEFRQLLAITPSNRLWQMPFAAALASGLPLLIGAYFGRMDFGLISSLGGMVFLYLPGSPLSHRMVWLMACGFGMTACYALGVMSHFFPPLMMWVLSFIAVLATMVGRFYGLGPPGSLFFVLATAIGAYSPGVVTEIPLKVGLFVMGSLLACLIAFFYSLYTLRLQPPTPVKPLPPPTFDYVIFDSVVIGAFVGISLALAQVLQLERPYWVPVSCIAVIQGMSLRAVWTKQVHRIVGTGIGLLLAWGVLMLPLDNWSVSLMMMALAFVIETAVVRHYGFAVIFITPLTILLAEAATLGHGSPAELIHSRFIDTILGCVVGLVGGVCLHSPRFRAVVGAQLRRLTPSRLMRGEGAEP
ncbi:FUSC family protein [Azoarcus sp. L1K30]|uniref:FUSC family protein n=1 Tax=Azoarcus sp. L1K30 TaxID=2820277 RepID=UPI001B81C8E7|nr:FUSC family protein [Azoarcus sp. L1K30]MBR0567478.1 FUSC family protein [Azoarcus sp. L1K30]